MQAFRTNKTDLTYLLIIINLLSSVEKQVLICTFSSFSSYTNANSKIHFLS